MSGLKPKPGRVWHPFTNIERFDREEKLVIESAVGNRLIDIYGREYIDGVASMWANIHGHSHPHIVEAIKRQADRLQHSTLLGASHTTGEELTERLVAHLPDGLSNAFYSSDGASAVEAAIKMAVQYWANTGHPEKKRIVSLDMAYHGDTAGTVSLGGEGPFRDPYKPLLFEPLRVPNPYSYRCQMCKAAGSCDLSCVQVLSEMFADRHREIAALVVEPKVQAAAGVVVAPEGHLSALRRLCDQFDVLLIADEIATGFGRTGAMFACDLEDVRPDILVLGKGMSGGYLPISATIATDRVYEAFYDESSPEKTLFHGHTFAGNPICSAAAIANLDLFEQDHVVDRVKSVEPVLKNLLREELQEHPHVGEIRQKGLMVGIEIVSDRESKKPFDSSLLVGWKTSLAARDRGVFVRPIGDTVILMPPLSIEEVELTQIVEAVSYGLDKVTGQSA